jgi:hypothetical protein
MRRRFDAHPPNPYIVLLLGDSGTIFLWRNFSGRAQVSEVITRANAREFGA